MRQRLVETEFTQDFLPKIMASSLLNPQCLNSLILNVMPCLGSYRTKPEILTISTGYLDVFF